MSKKKKILLILVVTIVIVGALIFVLSLLKKQNKEKKTVAVYAVSDLGYFGGYNYEDMLYGNVTSTKEQKVYINSNQKISKVLVKEGDKVKAGDVLLVYDTTAQTLQLETLATEVELARVAVLVAQRELEELKETEPVDETTETPTTQEPTTEAPTTEEIIPDVPSTPTDATPTDATPMDATTENPNSDGSNTEAPTIETPTTEAPVTDDNSPSSAVESEAGEDEDLAPEEKTYTKKELDQAIKDKEAEIRQLSIAYQMKQVSYEIMLVQNATGELICTSDGIVRQVLDQETAIANNEPFIIVGETDGYAVETAIGELALNKVQIGDTVTMMCYDDGMTYTGVITNISDLPYDENYHGDPSQSFYPMTVSVMDAENLYVGMYMEISMNGSMDQQEDSLYLSSAFVKYENGGYYVYKAVEGELKKCQVSVGTVSYGDLEITGGLSYDDYIAFPYSADTKEGLKTKEESVDKLYY